MILQPRPPSGAAYPYEWLGIQPMYYIRAKDITGSAPNHTLPAHIGSHTLVEFGTGADMTTGQAGPSNTNFAELDTSILFNSGKHLLATNTSFGNAGGAYASFEAVAKFNGPAGAAYDAVFGKSAGAGGYIWQFVTDIVVNGCRFGINATVDTARWPAYARENWHHMCVLIDASAGTAKLGIDGVQVKSITGVSGNMDNAATFGVGAIGGSPTNQYLQGNVAVVGGWKPSSIDMGDSVAIIAARFAQLFSGSPA